MKTIINNKRNTIKMILIFSIIAAAAILLFPVFHLSKLKKEDMKTIENGNLVITGEYGLEIPLNDITDVNLQPKLPAFRKRLKGFSCSGIKKGYFVAQDDTRFYVNVNSPLPPFIYLYRNDGVPVVVSLKDSVSTVSLYEQIENR